MGQWGSRLSVASKLLEVLGVMYKSIFRCGCLGRSDEGNSLNQTRQVTAIEKAKTRALNMICSPHELVVLLRFFAWLYFVCCCCVGLLWSSQVVSSVGDACLVCGIMCASPKAVLYILLVCPFHSQIVAT